jgi:hypothetical protein
MGLAGRGTRANDDPTALVGDTARHESTWVRGLKAHSMNLDATPLRNATP